MSPVRRTRSRSRRTSAAERARGEDGFTLVELIITSALLLVVLAIVLDTFVSMVHSEAYTSDRMASLDGMRVTLNKMTRELRQSASVTDASSTASHLEMDTYVHGSPVHVVYNASGGSLTRTVGSTAGAVVLKNLASTNLFTYVEAPPVVGAQWVQILLQVRPKRAPDTVLVLDSEVNLRNRSEPLS